MALPEINQHAPTFRHSSWIKNNSVVMETYQAFTFPTAENCKSKFETKFQNHLDFKKFKNDGKNWTSKKKKSNIFCLLKANVLIFYLLLCFRSKIWPQFPLLFFVLNKSFKVRLPFLIKIFLHFYRISCFHKEYNQNYLQFYLFWKNFFWLNSILFKFFFNFC